MNYVSLSSHTSLLKRWCLEHLDLISADRLNHSTRWRLIYSVRYLSCFLCGPEIPSLSAELSRNLQNAYCWYACLQNTTSKQMEMTTPVITRKGETSSEKMDMTTPVITKKVGFVWTCLLSDLVYSHVGYIMLKLYLFLYNLWIATCSQLVKINGRCHLCCHRSMVPTCLCQKILPWKSRRCPAKLLQLQHFQVHYFNILLLCHNRFMTVFWLLFSLHKNLSHLDSKQAGSLSPSVPFNYFLTPGMISHYPFTLLTTQDLLVGKSYSLNQLKHVRCSLTYH